MVREITSLKATEEPILIRARRQATKVVRPIAISGIEDRGSTYAECQSNSVCI